MRRLLSAAGLLAALILCGAQPAAAKPTEAQLDAIKANCRSDFMSNCWGVKRGGAEAFQCLKEHMASLSPGCQTAIKAATPAPASAKTPAPAKEAAPAPAAAEPAPAATPAPQQEAAPAEEPQTKSASPAPQESTPAPVPKPAVAAPASKEPAPEAAPPAKAAKTEPSAAPETSGDAPSAATEDAPAIIGFIPPRKKLMVQRHCRQELETYCADIDVGQGRVLRCLFSHKSALTPDCQGALAKLSN